MDRISEVFESVDFVCQPKFIRFCKRLTAV